MKYLLGEKRCAPSINKIMYQDLVSQYLMNMYTVPATPLIHAATKGSLDLVQLILERGADPWIKDPSGRTALDWARYEQHIEVAKVLEPISTPSGPRHDFVGRPGFHFRTMPMEEFDKMPRRKNLGAPHI